jgi:branched-chain amino acid transport system ATP-binding protein
VSEPLLSVTNVGATYDNAILALSRVSLTVGAGEIVALLGANGAGKTTTLRAISNLLSAVHGQITGGHVTFDGRRTEKLGPAQLVAAGLAQVIEGRHCFPHLTVEENLIAGASALRIGRRQLAADVARIYGYFPQLRAKRRLPAALCSGGEQQMTAIGRALMARPRLLMLDEPTMGLAPLVAREIFHFLRALNRDENLSILVAEQNATLALRYADRAYVLEHGSVALAGASAEVRERDDVKHFYLGFEPRQRRQYSSLVSQVGT